MPIIDVLIVRETTAPAPTPAGLAADLAKHLGAVFEAPPGRVWVKVQVLPAAAYAENGVAIAPTDLPTFVSVLHAVPPAGEVLSREALAISQAVAGVVGCPFERVHVEYAPSGRGRVAFGGVLVQ